MFRIRESLIQLGIEIKLLTFRTSRPLISYEQPSTSLLDVWMSDSLQKNLIQYRESRTHSKSQTKLRIDEQMQSQDHICIRYNSKGSNPELKSVPNKKVSNRADCFQYSITARKVSSISKDINTEASKVQVSNRGQTSYTKILKSV